MRKLLLVIALVFVIFEAFAFHPFGNFSFGWLGLAVFIGSFLVD